MAFREATLETKAAADRVWRVWSDVNRWPEWNPDMKESRIDGPLKLGAAESATCAEARAARHRTMSRQAGDALVDVVTAAMAPYSCVYYTLTSGSGSVLRNFKRVLCPSPCTS